MSLMCGEKRCAGSIHLVKHMITDKRFSYIGYEYINGSDKPVALQHFRNILLMLHMLHVREYIHADVRQSNI